MRIIKGILVIIISFLLLFKSYGQCKLIGKVVPHKSQELSVDGIKISAYGANSKYTEDGFFTLEYSHKKPGDKADILVNNWNANNREIFIVNSEEVSEFTISSNQTSVSLEIIICDKDDYDSTRLSYYKLLDEQTQKEHQALLAERNILQNRFIKDSILILDLNRRISQLESNYSEISKINENLSKQLANIDPRKSSMRNQDFLMTIDSEQNFDKALQILDSEEINNELLIERKKKIDSKNALNEIIKSLQLKTQLLIRKFNYSEAIESMKVIIDIYENDIDNNMQLAKWYANIIDAYTNNGDYFQALSYAKKYNSFLIETDSDNSFLANSYLLISNCYLALRKEDDAFINLEEGYEIFKSKYPEENIQNVSFLAAYGNLYFFKTDYQKSLQYYQRANEILKVEDDTINYKYAATHGSLANIYSILNEHNLAEYHHIIALDILLNLYDSISPEIAIQYINMGVFYKNIGNNNKAFEYFDKSLIICDEILNPIHPLRATTYENIGITCINNNDFINALKYFILAIEIKEKNLGPNNIELAEVYSNIASLYCILKLYDIALLYQKKALEISLNNAGEKSNIYISSLYSIGVTYLYIEEYDNAIQFLKKALKLYKELPYEDPEFFGQFYFSIGDYYFNTNKYRKSIKYHKKSIKERTKLHPYKQHDISVSYKRISNSYKLLGNDKKYLKYKSLDKSFVEWHRQLEFN